MKKSIIAGLIVLVLIGATSVWPRKATAQGPRQPQAACAILTINRHYDDYGMVDSTFIENATTSSNLPKIERGSNAAQVIADLKSMGLKTDLADPLYTIMSTP